MCDHKRAITGIYHNETPREQVLRRPLEWATPRSTMHLLTCCSVTSAGYFDIYGLVCHAENFLMYHVGARKSDMLFYSTPAL